MPRILNLSGLILTGARYENIFSAGNTAFSNPGNSDVVVGIDG